jgi:hypothetical protein
MEYGVIFITFYLACVTRAALPLEQRKNYSGLSLVFVWLLNDTTELICLDPAFFKENLFTQLFTLRHGLTTWLRLKTILIFNFNF